MLKLNIFVYLYDVAFVTKCQEKIGRKYCYKTVTEITPSGLDYEGGTSVELGLERGKGPH